MLRNGLLFLIFSLPVVCLAAQIEGQVIDDVGSPVEDMEMVLVDASGTSQKTYTDPGGNFGFYSLPGGNYTLYIKPKAYVVMVPYCGFMALQLSHEDHVNLTFKVTGPNGVAVDFGKPAGGVNIPLDGSSAYPHQFYFTLDNTSDFPLDIPPLTQPQNLFLQGEWFTADGTPVHVEISSVTKGADYASVPAAFLGASNDGFNQSTIEFELGSGRYFDTDGHVLTFDFTIFPSAWSDLAAANNVLCFCADDIMFVESPTANRRFVKTICTQVAPPSSGTGPPGDDSGQ